SSIVVSNNRSARSRNSGEYLRGMFLILLYGSEQNLGYFTMAMFSTIPPSDQFRVRRPSIAVHYHRF
ncbi:hypothetical protein, partial [Mycolicibacterium thermoresistibile]|uniref:hypothetical protein n=1 Tax=Mycolicibacterium thermoresistibile TaxID=1797 RepID=UPI001A7EE92E